MRATLDSNVLARAVYSVGGPAEEIVRRLSELRTFLSSRRCCRSCWQS